MSEAARSRREEVRYEPQTAVPGRDAPPISTDPLAELARLVGQDDPFRTVFRPGTAAAPLAATQVPLDRPQRYPIDATYPANAQSYHEGVGHHDDAYAHQHGDREHDGHAYDDAAYDDPHYGAAHHDPRHEVAYRGEGDPACDDRHGAVDGEAYGDEAGFAEDRFASGPEGGSTLPDVWAREGDGSGGAAPMLEHGPRHPDVHAGRRSSARRPLAVLAAVLVLTGGGLAASFFAKNTSASGSATAGSGRGAPTIMAASGPTKVRVEDPGATAPEDQDAALLNKTGNVSSGPVKIVSSQEQPADLGELPKASDLADGARPLPPPAPSPFPEPRKVKTFVVHPDGTMLSADASVPSDGAESRGTVSPEPLGSALPATPRTPSRGGTTPKSVAPPDAIAALSAQPADATAASPARATRQPASPGVRAASPKPTDAADAPVASGGSYGVQLASSPVEADANAAFAKLKKKFPSQLGPLTATVHKAETGDKPVYRVRVGSMSQDDAKTLCSQLQGVGGSCFVVRN